MDATVIICTYNRAESLRDTLRAVAALACAPGRQWEVVVVDNNSSDHTRTIVTDAQQDLPCLRYEFEGQQGLSHARNRGITSARGTVLLFTDDDVLPEPDWLETTLRGLDTYGADACGGFIAPLWEVPPPAWLSERFHGFLAIRSDRTDDYPITRAGDAPYGANMAIKRAVIDQVGLFDTNRGRKGTTLASGEDGEMFERVLAAGFHVVFLGGSRVHHKVEAFRLKKAYFRRWRLQTSRNLAVARGIPGVRRICNIPLYLVPQFLRALGRALVARIAGPRDEAFNREIVLFHFLGTFQGLVSARNRGPQAGS
jgi:glycosyltransferase involved in cell wall biosynthesis